MVSQVHTENSGLKTMEKFGVWTRDSKDMYTIDCLNKMLALNDFENMPLIQEKGHKAKFRDEAEFGVKSSCHFLSDVCMYVVKMILHQFINYTW